MDTEAFLLQIGLGHDYVLLVRTSGRRKNLGQNGLWVGLFLIRSSRCGLSVQPDKVRYPKNSKSTLGFVEKRTRLVDVVSRTLASFMISIRNITLKHVIHHVILDDVLLLFCVTVARLPGRISAIGTTTDHNGSSATSRTCSVRLADVGCGTGRKNREDHLSIFQVKYSP